VRPVILRLRERFVPVESAEMEAGLKFLPIALLLCFGVMGCQSVQPGDLRGTWVMTDASRQDLPAELQKAPATMFWMQTELLLLRTCQDCPTFGYRVLQTRKENLANGVPVDASIWQQLQSV